MGYLQELDALQRWIFGTAGLASLRLTAAPPKVARPMILWEAPGRSRDRFLGRYKVVNRVRAFGKLYASTLDKLLTYQDALQNDLEEKLGVLPVYDQGGPAGVQIGALKAVTVEWSESETLDVPFTITYEATYGLAKPVYPPPRVVTNRGEVILE